MPIKFEQNGFHAKYMKTDENGNLIEVSAEEFEKVSRESFSRLNPYRPIENHYGKPIKEVLLDIAEHIKKNEITNENLVSFFQGHSILFHNNKTNQLSSWWPEQLDSYDKAMFVCRVSCSCKCGPLDEPCNEQGPGSKVDFSFRKEETSK
jgi:hypothetical protein